MIKRIAVGVPARNEVESIETCLGSIIVAAQAVEAPASIVVVADSCSDGTADRARSVLRASGLPWRVAERSFGRVGPTRNLACHMAVALHRAIDHEYVWLATTDADSRVPHDWLVAHLRHEAAGWDGVAGLIEFAEGDISPELRTRFLDAIERDGTGNGHPHVHGANLGIKASAFLAAGGFADVAVGEDQQLWKQARRAGYSVVGTTDGVVTTSARRAGRAPGGLASFLEELSCSDSHR